MIKEDQLDGTLGHSRDVWDAAKEEARRILVKTARIPDVIEYGQLTREIHSIRFDPHGDDFRRFLGQLSWETDAAGRGMITAIVVHKHDHRPGSGFFTLAADLGRDISDPDKCWSEEVARVFRDFR
jgi:hypothetical protein